MSKTIFIAGSALLSLMSGALAQPSEGNTIESYLLPLEKMVVGQVKIMRTAIPYENVFIGASEVADITPINERKMAVTAKKEGITSLVILPLDRNEPSTHVAVQVVPHAQYKKSSVEVRSIGRNGHTRMSYWCDLPSGCVGDQKNYEKATAESVTVLNLPGGGTSETKTKATVP